MELKLPADVPGLMALRYLLLIGYFKDTGGYKAIHVNDEELSKPMSEF